MITKFDVSRFAVYFKISIAKLADKYSNVKYLSFSLSFWKNHMKSIKEIYRENPSEFT